MLLSFDLVTCQMWTMTLCLKNKRGVSITKFVGLLFVISIFWKSLRMPCNSELRKLLSIRKDTGCIIAVTVKTVLDLTC